MASIDAERLGDELRSDACDAWAKRLAACERSNTPKTLFHCDAQRKRWVAACSRDTNEAERKAPTPHRQ